MFKGCSLKLLNKILESWGSGWSLCTVSYCSEVAVITGLTVIELTLVEDNSCKIGDDNIIE
jgi:hypothetical protein